MRVLWLLAIAGLLIAGPMTAQYQPEAPIDPAAYESREDLAAAGDLAAAQRVVRFVQVSDAHIIDDDAPFPVRQEPFDQFGDPVDGAARDHEEWSDETLQAGILAINAVHQQDALDFVINTGDNIDNQLENELMRFIDVWEGTLTEVGPVSGFTCEPDGQSANLDDSSSDVTDACTHLPTALAGNITPLAADLPWYSAFGNHDGLIQGNVPRDPPKDEAAREFGRRFIDQEEYVDMHFRFGKCVGGIPGGDEDDDFGHGYGFATERLCDDDPDNDGYYSFQVNGVLFVVLDTLNDDWAAAHPELAPLLVTHQAVGFDVTGGYADGAIDPAQWQWFIDTMDNHPAAPVIVMAHHTVKSMFGESAKAYCSGGPCMADLLSDAGYVTAEEVTAELNARPNVLAFVGGHTHKHRIEAFSNADGGFWNVETSSLLDWPQQPRIIEVWAAPEGKWFLKTDTFDHDAVDLRDAARADTHADEGRIGSALDQATLLWKDLPLDVTADPQPEVPRVFALSTDNAEATVGQEHTFQITIRDLVREATLDDLNVTLGIAHASASSLVDVIPDGTPMEGAGNGTYAFTFTPTSATTHFATIHVVDPQERYEPITQVLSIAVAGAESESTGTPGVAVPAVVALLAALAARRR